MSDTKASALQYGLMLVHGNQPEALRALLVSWMKRYPLAPLENEVILVHSNGIAQWLKLALAADAQDTEEGGGCGIAAALDIGLPAAFLWRAYRAVLGAAAVPETSPFDKSRLGWRLLRLLPQLVVQPVYAPLRRFLENDDDARKRHQLAERLADVYDQYQVYRADWLAAWAAGQDVLIDARGRRRELADELRWQPALWRALLADVGAHGGDGGERGRAAVHADFLAAVAALPAAARPAGLPRRIVVFGISTLPRQSLEALAALSRFAQVLVCVHNPCQYYWADIVSDRQLLGAPAGRSRQARRDGAPAVLDETLLHLHAHPLLAAWGRQGRDFIGLLEEYDSDQARHAYAPRFAEIGSRLDLFCENAGVSLLEQLQDDLRELRPLAETQARWPAVDVARDRSIRFHVAHGALREVEILHDQLLAAFDADPTLRPRDVVVMVPDIDDYVAPIRAVFGLPPRDDARFIPFALADHSRRRGDALAQAVEALLALPQSRLAVSDLCDLLDVPALRRRFGIADDDLPLLRRWIRGANIRWGLHGEQRASLGLPAQPEAGEAPNSWLFGLRRMLLGYAVGDSSVGGGAWQGIEPYGEIGGLDAALLGPLCALIERLEAAWRSLREAAPPALWRQRLQALLADFFDAPQGDDAYLLAQLDGALQRWLEVCDEVGLDEPLPLSVVGEHWLAQLDEGSLAQRFFAGAVTFATLLPMRAIPFRHVCLLGMNDGDYPRVRPPLDFDLMGHDYRPGDRSRREDDRYLFLEALLSARDCLYVSWVGRSITDNTPRPPSVLVGQLRDHLAAGWRLAGDGETTGGDGALLAALTVEHRLQPFSRDYFAPSSGLFTYAREWRAALAVSNGAAGSAGAAAADAEPLPPRARDEPLALRELAEFVKSPVKAFFRQRLGVYFEVDDASSEDHEPFAIDGLGRWLLNDRLIAAQCAALRHGRPAAAALDEELARLRRSGALPAGAFGASLAAELQQPMPALFARYREELARWPLAGDAAGEALRLQLDDAGQTIELADWIEGVGRSADGARGRVLIETSALVRERRYRGERLIGHWLAHLAAHLAGGPLSTVVLSVAGEVEFAPLPVERARAELTAWLRAWLQGMRRPLPLAPRSALAWLGACPPPPEAAPPQAVAAALRAAREAYAGGFDTPGEVDRCAYLQRAYPDFAALLGGRPALESQFVRLAETLLRGLQQAIPVERARRGEKSAKERA